MSSSTVEAPTGLRAGVTGLLFVAVGGYVAWLTWAMSALPYDSWAPAIVGPALFLVSLPLLARISRACLGQPAFGVLCTALALKLVAAIAFVRVTGDLYDGVADYTFYDETGAVLAESYRAGHWGVHVDAVPGYGFVQMATGAVYTVGGTSLQVGFLVFSWLAFWGLVMTAVAVRIGLPTADVRRASWLILLLPSTLYWSSALGKDSWMVFAVGLTALGAAMFAAHRKLAYPLVLAGLLAAALVRPHVALMLLAAVGTAFLARRSRNQALGPVAKLAGIVLLAGAAVVLLTQTKEFLDVETLSPSGVSAALDRASTSSAGGAAAIAPPSGNLLVRVPWSLATVLFRPFLFEAHNVQAVVSAVEGTFLLVMTWRRRAALRRLPRLLRREPYLVFVVTYAALFVFAFSSFANLGTLARERVQLLPVLLVLLFLPEPPAKSTSRTRPSSAW
jgi:hypothetical protein